jgi:uncharacterized membrane protein YedE/YeeE
MASNVERIEWQILAAATGAVATIATRKVLTAAWRAAGRDAAEAEWGTWAQALTWGLAVGAGMGVARVIAQRAAAAGFERVTGDPPPVAAAS